MDRLGDLNLFLRVLDLGSISAAARSLDLSVAVASQRLKRLERALGVLLQRTTRRMRLTPEGAALVTQGRALIEDLDALTGGLHKAASAMSGTLRVSVPASFGRQYISPLVPQFLARHPRLKLHMDLSDQMRDLVRDGFDLAIRVGALPDSSLVARRLASNQRVLCAAPGYLERRGMPSAPEDLAAHDCLLLVGSSPAHDVWTLRGKGKKEFSVRVRGRLETNLGEVIRDAALAWAGNRPAFNLARLRRPEGGAPADRPARLSPAGQWHLRADARAAPRVAPGPHLCGFSRRALRPDAALGAKKRSKITKN